MNLVEIKKDAMAAHWYPESIKPDPTRELLLIVDGEEEALPGMYWPKVFDWDEVWIVRKDSKRIFDASVLFWKYK